MKNLLLISLILLSPIISAQSENDFEVIEIKYADDRYFQDSTSAEEANYKLVISSNGELTKKEIYLIKKDKLLKRRMFNREHYPVGEWKIAKEKGKATTYNYGTNFREYYVDTNLCVGPFEDIDSLDESDGYYNPQLKGTSGEVSFEQEVYIHVAKNTKYPPLALREKISGTTYLQFIVETDATVSQYAIVRGSHPALDDAAIEAVKSLNFSKPTMLEGEAIRQCFTLPVRFNLR